MQPGYSRPPAGERWNVNMPAVIGVVFVFLLGVVIWVVTSSDGGDDQSSSSVAGPSVSTDSSTGGAPDAPDATAPPATPTPTTPPTTTPAPLPSVPETTTPPTTVPPTSAAPTTEPTPPTTAPGAPDGAVPGDLAVPGAAMQAPPCDGSFITVLASAVGTQASGDSIASVLEQYPGSNYLRTDQTCPSLRAAVDGDPIYVVFLGPFAFDSDACAARLDGPEGAYARQLSTEVGPDHSVTCA